jgi:hypothetical protein
MDADKPGSWNQCHAAEFNTGPGLNRSGRKFHHKDTKNTKRRHIEQEEREVTEVRDLWPPIRYGAWRFFACNSVAAAGTLLAKHGSG